MSVNIMTIRYREPANNALNQATRFTQGNKRIECVYDYRNRRVEKAVYEGDTLRTRTRFIYRGYLQIAELDASTATESHPAILRKTYLWDPSEPTATRILALTTYDATGTYEAELYYTHDAQKNTTALFGIQAGRRAMYQYSAYGSLLKIDGDLAALNPFRFSSEYHDEDLDLIYYNYRYYNPTDGRWIHRDPIEEQGGVNLYGFVRNHPSYDIDMLGQENSYTHTVNPIPQPRPMPLPSNTANAAGSFLSEGIAVYEFVMAGWREDTRQQCTQYCQNYIQKEKIKAGCSCCTCVYDAEITAFGAVQRINFQLFSVNINPRTKCKSQRKGASMISRETLFQRPKARGETFPTPKVITLLGQQKPERPFLDYFNV